MQEEAQKNKNLYYNLSQVLEYEKIFKECSASMLQTCEAELDFWNHMQHSPTVDFNALNEIGERIHKHSQETEQSWDQMCKINPNYRSAIVKYTMFLKEIRNNMQKADELQNMKKTEGYKKALSNYVKNNETLFDDKTSVIHVSGNKEVMGKIVKMNKGTHSVFGYTYNELLQNSVSKLMPSIIGKKHVELMDRYFKTGHSKIINKERYLFGQHKDGYCFQLKLLVRPIPSLENGFIQYVGLLIRMPDDYEYILTDLNGTISSISLRLAETLGIEFKWLNQGGGLNIQLFAPKLISYYAENENGKDKEKNVGDAKRKKNFSDAGGEELLLIVPKSLSKSIKENSSRILSKRRERTIGGQSLNYLAKINNSFNKKKKGCHKEGELNESKMFDHEEYKQCLSKMKVKCQIRDMSFTVGKSNLSS